MKTPSTKYPNLTNLLWLIGNFVLPLPTHTPCTIYQNLTTTSRTGVAMFCALAVVVEQGLTPHQTHYRSYRDGFYGSTDPTNSVKALKEEKS